MSKKSLFVGSFFTALAVMTLFLYATRQIPAPQLVHLTDDIFLASQLRPEQLAVLRRNSRIEVVVDIRPDGEDAEEPPSSEMEKAAKRSEMAFHYIPVPHGDIPERAVESLKEVLSEVPEYTRTVLYCRSGRRAARTFALAEASRDGGPSLDEILKRTDSAGVPIADLRAELEKRISHRRPFPVNSEPNAKP